MEKSYNLDSIAAPCVEQGESAATKQNVSKFFAGYFKYLHLEKEWNSLKQNRKYSFSEKQAETLVSIYLERNKKLKRQPDGTYPNIDMDYIFRIFDGICDLLCPASSSSLDEVRTKLEKRLTDIITKNSSIEKHVKDLLSAVNIFINEKIGKRNYLKANHKYYWMQAMQTDFDRFIEHWIDIFFAMEFIQMHELNSEYINQWLHGNVRQEIDSLTKEQLAHDEAYQQLKNEAELSQYPELYSNYILDYESRVHEECTDHRVARLYAVPPIDPRELLEKAVEYTEAVKDWHKNPT